MSVSCAPRTAAPWAVLLLAVIASLAAPCSSNAQSVPSSERDGLVRLGVARGRSAEDIEALIRHADAAAAKGLPFVPLTSKIREGLAKGADPARIDLVVRQMAERLDGADQLMRELEPTSTAMEREAPVTLLAEAFGSGVTPDDVRDLRRQAPASGKPPLSLEGVASAAKGLSFIRDAKLPPAEGSGVIGAAVRQGFRPHEILDLGREIKRREGDYRTGRASLTALRDAITRGDRPDQLFRGSRPGERPAATRPAPIERPERTAPPERPQRPEQPERPVTTRTR